MSTIETIPYSLWRLLNLWVSLLAVFCENLSSLRKEGQYQHIGMEIKDHNKAIGMVIFNPCELVQTSESTGVFLMNQLFRVAEHRL